MARIVASATGNLASGVWPLPGRAPGARGSRSGAFRSAAGGLWYPAVAPDLSLPAFPAFGRLVDAETTASAEAAGAAELGRLSRALSALPVWDRALFTGAGLAERIQDYSAAVGFLERLIEIHPAEPQLWRRYAVAVSESAPPASAEPVLRRAVEILPKDAGLWERQALGEGLRRQRDPLPR